MKKIYNSPVTKTVVLGHADAILVSVSGRNNGLDDTEFDGLTGDGGITGADAKGLSSKNLWDTEW